MAKIYPQLPDSLEIPSGWLQYAIGEQPVFGCRYFNGLEWANLADDKDIDDPLPEGALTIYTCRFHDDSGWHDVMSTDDTPGLVAENDVVIYKLLKV